MKLLIMLLVTASMVICTQADTIFDFGAGTSDYGTAGNWTNGLPSDTNPGTIGTTGDSPRYDVTVATDATVLNNDVLTVLGSSTLKTENASVMGAEGFNVSLRNSSGFIVSYRANGNTGVFNLYDESSLVYSNRNYATYTYNLLGDGSSVTMQDRAYGGTYNVAAGSLVFESTGSFGGAAAGLLIDMTGGNLSINGYSSNDYVSLYNETDTTKAHLRFNGTNTANFADVFSYNSTGNILAAIPEPGTLGLFAVMGVAVVFLRRIR